MIDEKTKENVNKLLKSKTIIEQIAKRLDYTDEQIKQLHENIVYIASTLGTTYMEISKIVIQILKLTEWEREFKKSEDDFLNIIINDFYNVYYHNVIDGKIEFVADERMDRYFQTIRTHINLHNLLEKNHDKYTKPYFEPKSGLLSAKTTKYNFEGNTYHRITCTFDYSALSNQTEDKNQNNRLVR